MDIKELCMSLIRCDDEDEAIEILRGAGYWDDVSLWRDFGDNDNNYSTAGAQQSDPIAALVEKLVNSADARLMNECQAASIFPEGDEAPSSVREAVARFVEGSPSPGNTSTGRIENWTQSERTKHALDITVAATGSRSDPCFTIADKGEGQTPSRVPDTFMSLNKSNKLKTPFVQGKFNMGGTGAFRFCGKRSLQLIVTRRNPALVNSENADDLRWSFSIVRRDNPSGGERSSVYRYLAPLKGVNEQGRVLSFEADTMPLFPDGNEANTRESEYGSLVKLYNYKIKGRSNILMKSGLLHTVGVRLPNPALPMMFHECRNYGGKAGSYNTPFTGLFVRLSDNKSDNLEDGFPYEQTLTISDQKITIRVFGFKSGKAETYRNADDGLLFVVNGQTHGKLHSRFFKRQRVKLGYIADSLLAYVDCSELDRLAQEQLFMNTRESLADSEIRREIERGLEKFFKSDAKLKEFASNRRLEKLQDKLSDEKPLEDTLRNIMEKSPSLAKLFLGGVRLSDPFNKKKSSPKEVFKGEDFPSYFRFKGKASEEKLERSAEHGRSVRVKFETDVENNYFGRSKDVGTYNLKCCDNGSGAELSLSDHRMQLHDGVATLSIELPASVKEGDKLKFEISVSDVSQIEPLTNLLELIVVPKVTHERGEPKPKPKPPSDNDGDDNDTSSNISLPNAIWVEQTDWEDYEFDKYSALKIQQGPDEDGQSGKTVYDFYINADNIYLLTELKNSPQDSELLKEQFKIGMVLIGLAFIQDHSSDKDAVQDNDIEEYVEKATKALSMMMLPIINLLGELEIGAAEYERDAA